jgi:plastocyanin
MHLAERQHNNTMRILSILLLLGLSPVALFAQDCDGADHTVLAGNLYFNPADLTITAGETVAWINEGGFHDVNGNVSVLTGESFGNPEVFSLPAVSGDAAGVCMGTHTFTVPGTYGYDCSIGNHASSGMVGTITVEAAATGCNDALACNFDENATSDADCQYEDGTFDLSGGFWLVPGAALDPAYGCDIQPGVGTVANVVSVQGEPVTVVVDSALEAYINGAATDGLISSLQAVLLISALENATFSFCGNTMTGVAGLNTIVSEWNGQSWSLQDLGLNLAPVNAVPAGCGDPDALNYDPCTNPDETLCEYAALACDNPIACNYDSTTTGSTDCIYFDTELFTLDENDFIGLYDFLGCPDGYSGYDDFPVPLGQDSAGVPLTLTLFPEVEEIWNAFGFELAAQDVSTATIAICGNTMNYNSTIFGLQVSEWDGHGFENETFGSYLAPSSSYPDGCVDEEACNFDACAHPFMTETCEYVIATALETAEGDTGMVTIADTGTLTLIASPADGNTGEWFSACGDLAIDGNTAVLTASGAGDCEVCFTEANADGCEAEACIVITIIGGIGQQTGPTWQLMPNPAASELRVMWGGEAAVFEVFDLNGRRVHTATLQPGSQVLDVSTLQPGLYLAGPQGAAPHRLAIQR